MEITEEVVFRPQATLYYKLQSTFNIKPHFGSGVYDRLKKRAVFWWHGSTAKKISYLNSGCIESGQSCMCQDEKVR